MKTLFTTMSLLLTLSFPSIVLANSEWYGKEGQDMSPSYMEGAIAKLPKDDAEQFRNIMKDARENNKDLQIQVEKLHNDLHTILTAPTFDEDAFLAKRKDLQQLHDQMETTMTVAFASAVGGLSQDERVTLTRSLHEAHSRHYHGKKQPSAKYPSAKYPTAPKPAIADTAPANHTK